MVVLEVLEVVVEAVVVVVLFEAFVAMVVVVVVVMMLMVVVFMMEQMKVSSCHLFVRKNLSSLNLLPVWMSSTVKCNRSMVFK